MNPPPNECAAGSLCQGAGKTLGNHYCCRCKKTVHSVFCSKEVDSLEGNIKESFKDDEQKGSFKEVCNLCVEKATNQQPPAAASAVGAARDGADTASKEMPGVSTDPMVIDITGETEETTTKGTTIKKKSSWLNAAAQNKKRVYKMKDNTKPKDTVHKKSSATKRSRAGTVSYSVKEKLGMVKVWKDTINGTGRKSALAKQWGVNETTVRGWVTKEAQLQAALDEGREDHKKCSSDPLPRITHGLKLFYEANSRMPRDLKLPLTCKYGIGDVYLLLLFR